MNISLYQAAAAMKANARWQEVIGENISASFIPGFKRQDLSFSAVQAGLMAPSSTTVSGGSRHFAMPTTRASTDYQQGEMKRTGESTDLALEGRGFFEIQLPNGTSAYTRDGEFRLNGQGQMMTKQGYLVLGDAGPVEVDPNNTNPLVINPDGTIFQGAAPKGSLKVVDFNDYRQLESLGGGCFRAANPQVVPVKSAAMVTQGFVEAANTSTVKEMANLISSMRHFEANQRVVLAQDERMGRVIVDAATPM